MNIDAPHAALLEQPARRFDHDRRPGEICLTAVELVEIGGDRLVHEDLHDSNVLAADRQPWLAIDPKPVAGEWAYAVAPIVWNRPDAAARATSLRTHVRLRAEIVADTAGLDLERVGAWTLFRLVLNAVDAAEFAPASDEFRGRMIALAKAFTDPLV